VVAATARVIYGVQRASPLTIPPHILVDVLSCRLVVIDSMDCRIVQFWSHILYLGPGWGWSCEGVKSWSLQSQSTFDELHGVPSVTWMMEPLWYSSRRRISVSSRCFIFSCIASSSRCGLFTVQCRSMLARVMIKVEYKMIKLLLLLIYCIWYTQQFDDLC